ncbi:MAG: ribosome maturation factor RimM [Ostreibacterium sp.]
MSNLIEVGSIAGFFGVKGWVKLYSHTRPRVGIAKYLHFYTDDTGQKSIRFAQIKASGKNIIAYIEGVNVREDATYYIGKALYIKHSDLPTLTNEYYWHELIGLSVIDQSGQTLGKIKEMLETGANDVIVVQTTGGKEILIPYVMSHFVLSVDTDKGEMQVNWELDDNETY